MVPHGPAGPDGSWRCDTVLAGTSDADAASEVGSTCFPTNLAELPTSSVANLPMC